MSIRSRLWQESRLSGKRLSRRTGSSSRRFRRGRLERLEPRYLLAAVAWDGGGDGTSWLDPLNWDADVLPATGDDVTIDVAPDTTVVVSSGTQVINSLLSNEALMLSGGTLDVASTVKVNNSFTLAGGTLKNATVQEGDGGESLRISGTGNNLNGVTLNADLDMITASATVSVQNGLTLNGTATLTGSGARMAFDSSQTLAGTGTIVLGSTNAALHVLSASTTLTIGPNLTITGNNGTIGASRQFGGPGDTTVINQGTIRATAGGGSLEILSVQTTNNLGSLIADGGTLTVSGLTGNVGSAESINGGHLNLNGNFTNALDRIVANSTLTLNGTWTNTATISGNNASLNLNGSDWDNDGIIDATNSTLSLDGSFTTAGIGTLLNTTGTLLIKGDLDNTGDTLVMNATTGSWMLQQGSIQGGTVSGADGAELIISGTGNDFFDGVTLNADLNMTTTNAWLSVLGLTLNGTATLSGAGARLAFFGSSQGVDGTGTVILGHTNAALHVHEPGRTFTIGPDITITGNNGTIGASRQFGGPGDTTVINQGTIRATAGGGSLEILSVQTTNNLGSLIADGGTLTVSGLTGNVGSAESINGGHLNLNGNFTNALVDRIVANSTLTLNGTWTNTATISGNNASLNLNGSDWDNDGNYRTTTNSTLSLDGSFTTAGIGTLLNTTGTVLIKG